MGFSCYAPHLLTDDLRGEILVIARSVVEECPYSHDISAEELVELTFRYGGGKYIPVDIQDRVAGRMLQSMIRQVVGRISFKHDTAQRIAEFVAEMEPRRPVSIELRADYHVCDAAAAMTGRFLEQDELLPLPLAGCWGYGCSCYYTVKDSHKTPCPPENATFSGIEVIEVDEDEDEE